MTDISYRDICCNKPTHHMTGNCTQLRVRGCMCAGIAPPTSTILVRIIYSQRNVFINLPFTKAIFC